MSPHAAGVDTGRSMHSLVRRQKGMPVDTDDKTPASLGETAE